MAGSDTILRTTSSRGLLLAQDLVLENKGELFLAVCRIPLYRAVSVRLIGVSKIAQSLFLSS